MLSPLSLSFPLSYRCFTCFFILSDCLVPHRRTKYRTKAIDQAHTSTPRCSRSRTVAQCFYSWAFFYGDFLTKCFYARSPVRTCRCAHTAVENKIETNNCHGPRPTACKFCLFFFALCLFSAVVSACRCSQLLLSVLFHVRTHARTVFLTCHHAPHTAPFRCLVLAALSHAFPSEGTHLRIIKTG